MIEPDGAAYGVALLLFGFGSPVFCYLWLRSGYIPKPLAVWGLLASVWILGATARSLATQGPAPGI